jgi:NAD+ synthase
MGQSDEEELGFTYAELERYLEEGPQAVSPALAMRIERLTRSTEHKRNLPPIPDVD